jgi:hypothetical protein
MAILPQSNIEVLEFFEAHNVGWSAVPAAIGLTPLMMTEIINLTNAARSAYDTNQIQRDVAKASTQQWYNAIEALRAKGADYLKTIKAFAATTGNPNVFNIAQIPMPKTPTPTPAPGTPTNLAAALANDGAIELTWKASVALGTTFSVWRKLAGQAQFSQIGLASSETTFIDNTLPVGGGAGGGNDSAGGVWYQVRAHRLGLESGFSEPIFVRFGRVVENDGEDGGELKIAA